MTDAKFLDAAKLSDAQISKILDYGDVANAHIKSVRSEAFKRANARKGSIPGYKLAPGAVNRDWHNADTVAKDLVALGIPDDLIWRKSLASPAQIETALKTVYRGKTDKLKDAMAKFDKLVKKLSGGNLSLVRDIDPRDEVKKGHEFKDVAEKYGKSSAVDIDDDDLL